MKRRVLNELVDLLEVLDFLEPDDGELQLSTQETRKYALMFKREYRRVKDWEKKLSVWQKRLKKRELKESNRPISLRSSMYRNAEKKCERYAIQLEKAIEAFSEKVNEAKRAGM